MIENKILAGESKENQTAKYKAELEKKNANNVPIFYLYLKLEENLSKPSESDFKVLTYEDLYSILDGIQEKDLRKGENYKFLLDFKIHIKERLMKMLNLDTDEMKFYLDNESKLKKITNLYHENCKLVKDSLVNAFKEKFGNEFEIYETNRYIQVYKKYWDNGMVHFELLFKKNDSNFENIISQNEQIFLFCLHREREARNKYSDEEIPIYSKEEKFKFDSFENIIASRENIVSKFDNNLVKEYTEKIDLVINKKFK